MSQLHHTFSKRINFYLITLGLLLTVITSTAFAGNSGNNNSKQIVVSIKPLYSLVSHLTEGINQPVLLSKQVQTPHHHNLLPSERKRLANADMLVWLGAVAEPQLDKIMQQQSQKTVSVPVMQADNLLLLNKRGKHTHNNNHANKNKQLKTEAIDPHIWLSTVNAKRISQHIGQQLITNSPEHADKYQSNLAKLLEKIEQSRISIQQTLSENKQPYIAFHDAFQYFDNEYKLNYVGAISTGDHSSTSLKHLQQIKRDIQTNNVSCIVYQAPRPALIDTLSRDHSLTLVELDPLGLNSSSNHNAWFDIMNQLKDGLSSCLNS